MIPILFEAQTKDFTSNGIGRLTDCISCAITEERNGRYELVFKYPITGIHYDEIVDDRIVYVTHDNSGDKQPFIIYGKSAPINGIVTFNAHHVSYRLSDVIVRPFSATSVNSALNKFRSAAMTDQPFKFWTDKSNTGNFKVTVPSSIRSILGGTEGSIIDVYGGEYEFDKYTVKLYNNRGEDRNVTVRYGKNLTSLTHTYSVLNSYNTIVPYWSDFDGTTVYGNPVVAIGSGSRMYNDVWMNENDIVMTNQNGVEFDFDYYLNHSVTMDFTAQFAEAPTKEQLHDAAAAYLENNSPWIPNDNIKFNFADLWGTELQELTNVRLCDTVTVVYTALGVSAKAKVIKTVWNPLLDRYDSLEMGDPRTTLQDAVARETSNTLKNYSTTVEMESVIDEATKLITGGMGGHVVFAYDNAGKPTEIFVMDTEDVNTAVHVLRINVNGIGFSSSGISGPFTTAWTLDGHFVANFIDTGTLSANLIRAGILASADGTSYWDLDSSEFVFTDKRFDSTVKLDEGYIEFAHQGKVFGRLIRMLYGENDVLSIQGSDSSKRIVIGDTFVRINVDDMLITFDSGNKYISLRADNDNWMRIDAENDYIWMKTNQLISNGYGGYTGSVTISGKTLTFHNGILTNVQ